MECWNERDFGLPKFVQDNFSQSKKGVLRGLHYQCFPVCQGKLVRCTNGSVYDVIVDLRQKSKTFGKWYGVKLDRPELILWAPPGMAHGFYTLSEVADFNYKVSNYYDNSAERVIAWDDSTLGISWPLDGDPILSKKDIDGAKSFKECTKL